MTKTNELEILDKAIRTLGTDSYLGPWLSQVRAEVESNIRSDFFPLITIADAQAEAARIISRAHDESKSIVENAKVKAAVVEKDANKLRESIASAIYAAQRELNRF